MDIQKYVEQLSEKLDFAGDPERAVSMSKYMRDQFSFYGVAAPIRKKMVAEHVAEFGYPNYDLWLEMAKYAWKEPREVQYACIDIWIKRKKYIPIESTHFFEWIITHDAWWDTVDLIASSLVGQWALSFPEKKTYIQDKWLTNTHLWLQRTAIIYQLKYKHKTDVDHLKKAITQHANHPDFFIRKAIGWALREYSKTDEKWVRGILDEYTFSNLSVREALKWLNNR